MKKAFLAIAILFALISIVFTVLPMGTLAVVPIAITLIFGYLGFRKSEGIPMHISRLTLFAAGLMLLIVIGKEIFIKDDIVVDQQFEQKKADAKKEDVKQLEELEGLE
jgi:EamA domain-containing membrane protein RarD